MLHPEWGKGLRKSLWIPHIQVIPFLNVCHLADATEPQIPGQPGTRTVSSPRQSTLWTVKCSPHYAIKMCSNLIFICYHLHPSTSLHLIIFHSIIYSTTVHTIYLFFNIFFNFCLFIFTYVYFFILILFLLSVCCCLCVLEAYVTKTNSLYVQSYLAIMLFLILILIEEQMSLWVHHCEWMDWISFLDTCNVNLSIVFCVSDIMTSVNAPGVRRLFWVLYVSMHVYHERFQWLMGSNVPDNLTLFWSVFTLLCFRSTSASRACRRTNRRHASFTKSCCWRSVAAWDWRWCWRTVRRAPLRSGGAHTHTHTERHTHTHTHRHTHTHTHTHTEVTLRGNESHTETSATECVPAKVVQEDWSHWPKHWYEYELGFFLVDTDTKFNKQLLADTDTGQLHKAGLKNRKKKISVHFKQNRYLNVSVPAFLCIITIQKPVWVEKTVL